MLFKKKALSFSLKRNLISLPLLKMSSYVAKSGSGPTNRAFLYKTISSFLSLTSLKLFFFGTELGVSLINFDSIEYEHIFSAVWLSEM